MKTTNSLSATAYTISFVLLAACGGPHVPLDSLKNQSEGGFSVGKIEASTLQSEGQLDFGKLPSGYKIERKIKLSVKSPSNLQYTYELESGRDFSIHQANTNCTGDFQSVTSCQIAISFDTQAPGKYTDVLIIKDSEGNITQMPVTGERIAETIAPDQGRLVFQNLQGGSADFGTVAVGGTNQKTITLLNPTDSNVEISDYKLGSNTEFSLIDKGTCGQVVKPGTCSFTVAYKPKNAGADLSTLQIVEKSGGKLNGKLKGTGQEAAVCTQKKTIEISALKSVKDASSVIYPYLFRSSQSEETLGSLYGTATNKMVDTGKGQVAITEDAQVLAQFEIPVSLVNAKITNVSLRYSVSKVINDDYRDTEMLCLSTSQVRRCSGHLFEITEWLKLKNKAFFGSGGGPVTTTYEDHLAASSKKCGHYICEDLNETLSLNSALSLSQADLKTLGQTRLLNFIWADDTRLNSLPTLVITTEETAACAQ